MGFLDHRSPTDMHFYLSLPVLGRRTWETLKEASLESLSGWGLPDSDSRPDPADGLGYCLCPIGLTRSPQLSCVLRGL